MKFQRRTRKLFYEDATAFSCTTEVVKCSEGWLEFKDTVFYPEGGGQDADTGWVQKGALRIRLTGAKKMYSHGPGLVGFPDIQVDGIVLHQVHADDLGLLAHLQTGDPVSLGIDIARRYALSLSHSASHLLYIATGEVRPDVIPATLGCHIQPGRARFDFQTPSRFSPQELAQIQARASDLSMRGLDIFIRVHPLVPDARTWCCGVHTIPCGGTHIANTTPIGPLLVRRKSLGAGKERLVCEFPQAQAFDDHPAALNIRVR